MTGADEFIRAEEFYGLSRDSLTPNSQETPLGLGGYDRPRHVVENADEVIARFREGLAQVLIECAYCGERIRSQGSKDGTQASLRWFRQHNCAGEGEFIHLEDLILHD